MISFLRFDEELWLRCPGHGSIATSAACPLVDRGGIVMCSGLAGGVCT